MPISTYASLQTAVADWLKRSDLTSNIPDFIRLAEHRIAFGVRCRDMANLMTLTASTSTLTLSASTLEIVRINIQGTAYSGLEYRNPETFVRAYKGQAAAATGAPRYFTREGDLLRIVPVPSPQVTLNIQRYRQLAPLSLTADTNTLLTRATGLYLYGALLEAAPFLGNDQRLPVWASLWEQTRDAVQTADRTP